MMSEEEKIDKIVKRLMKESAFVVEIEVQKRLESITMKTLNSIASSLHKYMEIEKEYSNQLGRIVKIMESIKGEVDELYEYVFSKKPNVYTR